MNNIGVKGVECWNTVWFLDERESGIEERSERGDRLETQIRRTEIRRRGE